MYRVISQSRAVCPPSCDQICRIVGQARDNNPRLGVTGRLLYLGGRYFQVLEGPREAVLRLINRIGMDRGHCGQQVLAAGETEARAFADWKLGCACPDALPADLETTVFGLSELAAPGCPEAGAEPAVRARVLAFVASFGAPA